jgi:hypothetical protein
MAANGGFTPSIFTSGTANSGGQEIAKNLRIFLPLPSATA